MHLVVTASKLNGQAVAHMRHDKRGVAINVGVVEAAQAGILKGT